MGLTNASHFFIIQNIINNEETFLQDFVILKQNWRSLIMFSNIFIFVIFLEESVKDSCAVTIHAISQKSPDVLKAHAANVLPLAFLAMHQEKVGQYNLFMYKWVDTIYSKKYYFSGIKNFKNLVSRIYVWDSIYRTGRFLQYIYH